MEETRMLQQVLQQMEALISGTNPIDGEELPADSVLRREDLVRSFRYIARKIGRELGCPEPEYGEPEELSAVLGEIARSLNIQGRMGSLLSHAAKEWLTQEGYLTDAQTDAGNPSSAGQVTPKGKVAGLSESGPDEKGYTRILLDGRAKNLLRMNRKPIMALERRQWEPLIGCLTAEWRSQIICTPEPVGITTFLRQIESRLPQDLPRSFNAMRVNLWMLRNGYFEICYNGAKRWYNPTRKGKMLGFALDQKKILWPAAAQQFLLDHLKTIALDMASCEAWRLPVVPERIERMDEVRAQMEYSGQALDLYRAEEQINQALASTGNDRLPHGILLHWLRQKGYYAMQDQRHSDNGQRASRTALMLNKKALALTAQGQAAGFLMDHDNRIMLGESAWHLVLDELEDIWALYYSLDPNG